MIPSPRAGRLRQPPKLPGRFRPCLLALLLDDERRLHLPATFPASTRCGRPLDDRRRWRVVLRSYVDRRQCCADCWRDAVPSTYPLRDLL